MPRNDYSLSKRQAEVLALVAKHFTNTEAAEKMGLSTKTIELHIGSAMQKLRAKNRHHAVELARKLGFLH